MLVVKRKVSLRTFPFLRADQSRFPNAIGIAFRFARNKARNPGNSERQCAAKHPILHYKRETRVRFLTHILTLVRNVVSLKSLNDVFFQDCWVRFCKSFALVRCVRAEVSKNMKLDYKNAGTRSKRHECMWHTFYQTRNIICRKSLRDAIVNTLAGRGRTQTRFARTHLFWFFNVAPLLVFLSRMVTSKCQSQSSFLHRWSAVRKYSGPATISCQWLNVIGWINMHRSSDSICYLSSVQQFNFPNGKRQLWRSLNPICLEIALRQPFV